MARNEELDQWVQRYPAPAQGPMHFVSGMFLVNREDTLLTSADGTAWTAHPPAPTWMFQSVANGNGIFVATGFPPKLLTSRDGLTWRADRRFGFEGVAFDGERFVAGANTIATSRDGTTWEAVETSGDVSSFWRIIWANGLYLSTGVDSQYQLAIGTSKDAVTWKRAATPGITQHPFNTAVAAGPDRFVVAARDRHTLVVYTSDDGITWTRQPDRPSDFEAYGFLGAYGNGWFVMAGFYDPAGVVMSSPDGITWTAHIVQHGIRLDTIAYGNGTFVVSGRGAPIFQSAPVKPPYEVGISAPGLEAAPGDPGFFTVRRGGHPSIGIKLVVNMTIGGTAASGVDYEPLTNQVVIPAGQASVHIPVLVRPWAEAVPTKSLILNIEPGEAYTPGQDKSASLLLVNPGRMPRFRLSRMARQADGSVNLVIDSPVGAVLDVDSSSDLATWSRIATVTNTIGSVRLLHQAGSDSSQFYRAKVPRVVMVDRGLNTVAATMQESYKGRCATP